MANPSPNDLIAANFIIWGDNGKAPSDATTLQLDINGAAFSDPNLADWQPFALSSQNPQWTADGMYTAAFEDQ